MERAPEGYALAVAPALGADLPAVVGAEVLHRVVVLPFSIGGATPDRADPEEADLLMQQLIVFGTDGLVVDRREQRVQNNLKHFIYHLRKQLLDEFVWNAQVGVVVDLQQPGA